MAAKAATKAPTPIVTRAARGITLGQRYTDSITGVGGIATSVTAYITGCDRVGLSRVDDKGDEQVAYVDTLRLVDEQGRPAIPEPSAGVAG